MKLELYSLWAWDLKSCIRETISLLADWLLYNHHMLIVPLISFGVITCTFPCSFVNLKFGGSPIILCPTFPQWLQMILFLFLFTPMVVTSLVKGWTLWSFFWFSSLKINYIHGLKFIMITCVLPTWNDSLNPFKNLYTLSLSSLSAYILKHPASHFPHDNVAMACTFFTPPLGAELCDV